MTSDVYNDDISIAVIPPPTGPWIFYPAAEAVQDSFPINSPVVPVEIKKQILRITYENGKVLDFKEETFENKHVIEILTYRVTASSIACIDLRECVGITDESLLYISTACSKLTELYISNCIKITDAGITALVEKVGKKLTTLHYSQCTKCSNVALDSIINNCPRLQELYANNAGISNIPQDIGEKLPNLNVLGIRQNSIKTIPQSLMLLEDKLKNVKLQDNPLQDPPLIIAQQGLDAIFRYFKIQQEGLSRGNAVCGMNDSPTLDPDRLGSKVYAESICEVVHKVEKPQNSICIALFGPWGSGKSFLHKLILQAELAWTEQKNKARLDRLKDLRSESNVFVRINDRTLQCLCDIIAFCCCCCKSANTSPHRRRTESMIATLITIPLLWPIWICLYLILSTANLILEVFLFMIKTESISPDERVSLSQSGSEEQDNSLMYTPWRNVRDILTGDTTFYSENLYDDISSCVDMFQILILSSTQHFFKFLYSQWNPFSLFWSCCSSSQLKVDHEMRKYIYVDCNAWLYNGTDLLWASLLEEMWSKVEAEFGIYRVRFHRFSIHLSGELQTDDPKVKKSKRKIAILKWKCRLVVYLILSVLGVLFYKDLVNLGNSIFPALGVILSPLVLILKDASYLFLLLIGRSKGAQILQDAQYLQRHKRADFSQETGFMGEVRIEVVYLYDFLQTEYITDWKFRVLRPVRLSIFLDDLDRCQPSTIVDVLEAVMLLILVDAPITIWLPIDSRVVVASIEKHYGNQFLQDGLDGYKFLNKIIQLSFCIPDLDSIRKVNYMKKIFEKDELDAHRLYERLNSLKDSNMFPGILALSLQSRRVELSTKEQAIKALIPVLEKMISMPGVLPYDEDIETCFCSPSQVLETIKSIFATNSSLDPQVEEEFLHFISIGIQDIVNKKNKGSSVELSSSSVFDEGDQLEQISNSGDDLLAKHDSTPNEYTEDDVRSNEQTHSIQSWYEQNYQPMMNDSESECFEKYADTFAGEPRKIKRIIMSYMVSRTVAKKLNFVLASQKDFREKLLKMTILFEQWPYRMAWILVIVKNIQQEKSLQDKWEGAVAKAGVDRILQQKEMLEYQRPSDPIGNNLTSIVARLSKLKRERGVLHLPILQVYHQLVQSLIHSPENSHIHLQRDGDPQAFEILLAEPDALLVMKDLALPSGKSASKSTLRPYLFNLQRHMIEKVQHYLDNCILHSVQSKDEHEFGVYEKKIDFFNQKHPMSSQEL